VQERQLARRRDVARGSDPRFKGKCVASDEARHREVEAMSDRATRKMSRPEREAMQALRASLVIVEGGAEGSEFALERERCVVGRGPGVDLALDDAAMSRQHAAFERGAEGWRVRDLGSTNGVRVNGAPVEVADLKHGDRVALGEHVLQYLVEVRERGPRTYKVG
jgi:pSer/pThr/pTyr-binding forkhead associated (FHA) protein